jgi:hypothetical protein
VTGSKNMLRRVIGSAYKAGYDEIDIRFSSHDELKQVQSLTREQFAGFSIISQNKDIVSIKNLSENRFESFDSVLRRLFLIIEQMSLEVPQALKKDDDDWLKNLSLLKVESDKCADYCRRAINLDQVPQYNSLGPLYNIIEQLEKVMDRYRDICTYAVKKKTRLDNKCLYLLESAYPLIVSFREIFYKYDTKDIVSFGQKKELLQVSLDGCLMRCPKEDRALLVLLDRIINMIFDLNGSLMVLNHKRDTF